MKDIAIEKFDPKQIQKSDSLMDIRGTHRGKNVESNILKYLFAHIFIESVRYNKKIYGYEI